MFARELVALFSLFVAADAIQCNVQTTNMATSTQVCPANIYQCIKFTCTGGVNGGGMQSISRGCNDPLSPTGCTTLTNNCAQQGGRGDCYTCSNFDFCNGATSSPIITAFIALLTALYATL